MTAKRLWAMARLGTAVMLLCLASALMLLWLRSYWRLDYLKCWVVRSGDEWKPKLNSAEGELLISLRVQHFDPAREKGWHFGYRVSSEEHDQANSFWNRHRTWPARLGFGTWGRAVTPRQPLTFEPETQYREVLYDMALPHWLFALIFGYFGIRIVRGHVRLKGRLKRGHCPKCNYDLRAHHPGDKCPECGGVIPPTVSKPQLAKS